MKNNKQIKIVIERFNELFWCNFFFMPASVKFETASAQVFRELRTKTRKGLDINKLNKEFPGTSKASWKLFKKALKKYKHCRKAGTSHDNSIIEVKSAYPSIVLEKFESFKATKHDVGVRRGKHPKKMQKKRGRKRKASSGTFKRMSKKIKLRPNATDEQIAEMLNLSLSQKTDENISQPENEIDHVTVKGMKKINAKDVQKWRTRGKKNQEDNNSGNRRGMGPRNLTVQRGRKYPSEWVETHGENFIDARSAYDPSHICHFDTTHWSSKVCKTENVKGPQGGDAVKRTHERVQTGASGYAAVWAGGVDHHPGMYTALEPNFKKCKDLKNAKRGIDDWPCSHGPAVGITRKCGGGGTRYQHVIHLKNALIEFFVETGIKKRKRGERKKDSDPIRVLQLDKSTNLIYLRAQNRLGYNGIPTKRLKKIINELETSYCVQLDILVQPTHYFCFNACDALLFSLIKSNGRKIAAQPYSWPKNLKDLREIWDQACENVSDHALQASVKRAHSVDSTGARNLGNPPYDSRLNDWEERYNTQSLLTYESYPYNISDEESEADTDEFW